MRLLAVDAAYCHSSSTTRDVNCWSADELNHFSPAALKARVEAGIGGKLTHCVWHGARDGRWDSGGARLDRRLKAAGFETRFRRMKVDEVRCRNRDCQCRHRDDPIFVRRQAGVDVDIAARTLELALGTKATVVLASGDGDLASLVETLIRNGCKVFVAAFDKSLSPELADLALQSAGVLDLKRAHFHRTRRKTYRVVDEDVSDDDDEIILLQPEGGARLHTTATTTSFLPASLLASSLRGEDSPASSSSSIVVQDD